MTFHAVSHNILLEKLLDNEVKGLVLDLSTDYIKNRTQRNEIENVLSNPQMVTVGIHLLRYRFNYDIILKL